MVGIGGWVWFIVYYGHWHIQSTHRQLTTNESQITSTSARFNIGRVKWSNLARAAAARTASATQCSWCCAYLEHILSYSVYELLAFWYVENIYIIIHWNTLWGNLTTQFSQTVRKKGMLEIFSFVVCDYCYVCIYTVLTALCLKSVSAINLLSSLILSCSYPTMQEKCFLLFII